MSPQCLEADVEQVLKQIPDPQSGLPIGSTGQIHRISVENGSIQVTVGLTSFAAPLEGDFQNEVLDALRGNFPDAREVDVKLEHHERPVQPLGASGLTANAVIAVGSGKGGVGKSTVAVGLALALKESGCRVGILDADVYGPSIPHLTGVRGQASKVGDKIGAFQYQGMPLMSIGFMVPPNQAVIWRGPMLHSAVNTFIRDVAWGDLDYLIIDMPPGTGDVALTLSQSLPVTGAVVVCTPQEVALIDAIKAIGMFGQVKIPVLGVVENMSSFVCPDTGKRWDIFGKGGARQYSEDAGLPFLGSIPIHIPLREAGDRGAMDQSLRDPNSGPYFKKIAYQLVKEISRRAKASTIKAQLPVLG